MCYKISRNPFREAKFCDSDTVKVAGEWSVERAGYMSIFETNSWRLFDRKMYSNLHCKPEKCFCLNLYLFELGPPLFISLATHFFFIAGLSPITSNFVLLKKLKSRAKTTLTNWFISSNCSDSVLVLHKLIKM